MKQKFKKIQENDEILLQPSKFRSVVMKLRSRINKIIDGQFSYWIQKLQRSDQYETLTINESMLEQWVEMFKNQVIVGKHKTKRHKQPKLQQSQIGSIRKINLPKPLLKQKQKPKKLISISKNNPNLVNILEIKPNSLNSEWLKPVSYEIPQKRLKPFCSITYSEFSNSLIIIGGHKISNPNLKSSKISQLSLDSPTFTIISNLPYGLSSHTAISHNSDIFIIGGNKNHSIITKGCFKLDLQQNKLEQISCLNYPVANSNCIIWKQRWIYKFGGIGEAFGQWDNSPYIERYFLSILTRYSINDDFWQVVNPSIQTNNLFLSEIFLANSSSYICEKEDNIFVFGGHNIDGKYKSNGFVLKIQESRYQQTQDMHVIEQYGSISCGQVCSNNFIFVQNLRNSTIQMYSLKQAKLNQDNMAQIPTFIHTFQ